MTTENLLPPNRVFIVPYRNRVQHKFFFSKYMSFILEDSNDYEIYFSHQCDSRTFNRGAMKNIGFLAIKEKYPNHYQDMTFIFNDVDTLPFNKIFDYTTTSGTVKHYYGYKYALGGIVVMKGADFEKINGFPCYWGWGMEDNVLQKRCEAAGLKIDRSIFYNIGSPQILQLFDGITRIISKKDPWRMKNDNGIDGLTTINKLEYFIDIKSENPSDNIFSINNPCIFYINIHNFLTYLNYENDNFYSYDLREPQRKIINPSSLRETKQTVVYTEDWTNIPYYPTTKERRIIKAKEFISSGQQVPLILANQIHDDNKNQILVDEFNRQPTKYETIQQNKNKQIQQQKQTNIYSIQYAIQQKIKPRASTNTKIKLGGVV
jgi:hypothetical protein